VGSLEVVDIGIPQEVIEQQRLTLHLLDIDQALADLPSFDPSSHKFTRGALLVVAGSRQYAGAALLTAVSALRTGCGIVYLAGPESIRTVIQSSAPEIIFVSQPETATGSIGTGGLSALLGETRHDAVAVGPGLTTDPETIVLVHTLIERCERPMLVDADGINAFTGEYRLLVEASKRKEIVISPHSGELKRLTGEEIPESPTERIGKLRELVGSTGIVLVHKGAPTVIAHPEGRCDINPGGHPGMATAGSGDVLTGAVAGFLAQGCGAAAAARLGVYLHSRAAVLSAEDFGERAMIAGDCMYALPLALTELEDLT
jgi:NAD(P)H-hydrate epimerase